MVIGPDADASPAEVMVLASGNLGLVYLTHDSHRLTRAQIDARYPELIPTLLAHPGIGFLLVATEPGRSVVLGEGGQLDLATGVVHGDDPLALFGPAARTQVSRTDAYPHCADLMVNSLLGACDGRGGRLRGAGGLARRARR